MFCCTKTNLDPDLDMDNASAPSTFYPLEPGKPGKFIFITGIPGSGKSKIAQLMAQKFGFKYYEGDATFYSNNPYIPLDSEEPSLCSETNEPMKVRFKHLTFFNSLKNDFFPLVFEKLFKLQSKFNSIVSSYETRTR